MLMTMSTDHPIPEDTRERIVTPANGVTTITVPFYFQTNDDIGLYVREDAGADWVKLTEGTGYSLTGAGVNSGGTVTLASPADGTANYRVRGDTTLDRVSSVLQGGSVKGATIDEELDRTRLIQQEQRRDIYSNATNIENERQARIAAVDAEADARRTADQSLSDRIENIRVVLDGTLAQQVRDDADRAETAAAQVLGQRMLAGHIYERPDGIPSSQTTVFLDVDLGYPLYWSVDRWKKLSDNSDAALPTFDYDADATAFFSTFAVAPLARRKKTIHRAIQRLKAAGLWTKLSALYIDTGVEDEFLRNWKTGVKATKVGAPTYTPGQGFKATASGQYIRLGVYLDGPAANSISAGFRAEVAANVQSSNYDFGARDASANGIFLRAMATTGRIGGACGGAANTVLNATGYPTDGAGHFSMSRTASTGFTTYRNGRNLQVTSNTSAAMGHVELYGLTLNDNGSASASYSPRGQSMWFVASGLTDAEAQTLFAITESVRTAITHGELDAYYKGFGPEKVAADVVCYGLTPGSLCAAIEAKRQGRSVVIVAGYREQRLGGMITGGLGWTDLKKGSSWGGIGRLMTYRNNVRQGITPTSTIYFEPEEMFKTLLGFFDPTRGGWDIPIFFSGGVMRAIKSGKNITKIITRDGRQFSASVYIDGSYEGDLLRIVPGVTVVYGREAAGTGAEAVNGWRGPSGSVTAVKVDPFVTEGVPSSGLLPCIEGGYLPDIPIGSAMAGGRQAFNFRMTLTYNLYRKIDFADAAPTGYNALKYEPMLRMLAANPSLTVGDFVSNQAVNSALNIFDVNNNSKFSTNLSGGSLNYIESDYDAREAIITAHRRWIEGFWYTMRQSADPRMPAGFQSSARNWGLDTMHYLDPWPGDPINWPTQLYVRTGARFVGDFVYNANDLVMAEGTTPRDTRTIGMASYFADNHGSARYAYEYAPGQWMMHTEGDASAQTAGDQTVPIPYGAIVPKREECQNLLSVFNTSATYLGMALLRMEPSSMQMGQSGGMAAAIAIELAIPVQDVPYATLRSRLQAVALMADETVLVLDQVN